ncbi:hypothetical protein PAXRUDRAFT_835404 [Paxillus rubicundulus Ve08.2h10]|uniref:Uncharacterized protein n=1 Tax=Paxillus rubicundulus Ve08.2h10 TaxID=930991 RepID=A0A0D0BYT5_9AGAM|nr:hypothetical protein PAXRUDRAFT_835404 [Paxillus rubicundulus Ve08.2h10]
MQGQNKEDLGARIETIIVIWLEHTTKEITSYNTVPLNCKECKWQWLRWELSDEFNHSQIFPADSKIEGWYWGKYKAS